MSTERTPLAIEYVWQHVKTLRKQVESQANKIRELEATIAKAREAYLELKKGADK